MILNINNLHKHYGSYTVLKFDEWQIGQGIHWLKGGNGTGKTTLFKILAGQIPFQGRVSLGELSLHKDPVSYKSLISYAEAEPQYPGFITGKELLDYYNKIRKANTSRSDEITDAFEMTPYMNNKIESYSSGMLKKLSLICAFSGAAQFYLLDEPLITIDKAAANVLYAHMEVLRKQGCTVILSSHQEVDPGLITLSNTFTIVNQRLELC